MGLYGATFRPPAVSAHSERNWAIGRALAAAAAALYAHAFLGDTYARNVVYSTASLVAVYDLLLVAIINPRKVRWGFYLGFALDHAALVTVWVTLINRPGIPVAGSMYLIVFPMIILGMFRFGWALGLVYTVCLIGWTDWSYMTYWPPGVTETERAAAWLLLGSVGVMASILVYKNQAGRVRSERRKDLLTTIQRHLTNGLVVVDEADVIEYCNPVAAKLANGRPSEFIGHSLGRFAGRVSRNPGLAEVPARLASVVSTARDTVEPFMVGENLPDSLHIEITVFPIPLADGHLTGLILRDASHQWEIERKQYRFVSLAAHELRTPITAVMGFSELLVHRPPSDEAVRAEWTRQIANESRRLTEIVDDLMSVTEIESGDLSPFAAAADLNQLIQRVASRFDGVSSYHVITLDLTSNDPSFVTDATMFRQVVTHLVGNAIKYSPDGGEVQIQTRIDHDGDFVVSVTDQGVGIAEADRHNLFRPFGRIKHSETTTVRGTGLGLYIVKELVELLGGRVWYDSARGEGSMFAFAIPSLASSERKSDQAA